MTTMVASGVLLDAPTPEAMQGSLLDTFAPQAGRVEPGDGLYVSANCLALPDSRELCEVDPTIGDWEEAVVVDGVRFVSDIGIKCQALAYDNLDQKFARAVDLLESASVEQNLMALRFTGTAGGDAAVDLTPSGGAVTATQGMALLEGDAAKNYVGLPTIHAPVTVASLLTMQYGFKLNGPVFRTPLGSKFVVGSGYDDNLGPDGDPPADGEMWMYATGEIDIVRGNRLTMDPILDRGSNIMYVRSQRTYVVVVDCYLSAVRVKIYE